MDEGAVHGGMGAVAEGLPALVVGSFDNLAAETADGVELGLRGGFDHEDFAGTAARRAARATPWAALPALTVQTPRRRWSSGRRRTAFQAPRILKEPMGCRFSNLR